MPTGAKWIFSIALVIIAVAFAFVDPNANNAGPDWMWRGGKNDPIRNLLCDSDGKFYKWTKTGVFLYWIGAILILWLVVPTR